MQASVFLLLQVSSKLNIKPRCLSHYSDVTTPEPKVQLLLQLRSLHREKKPNGILEGPKYSGKDTLSCRNTGEWLYLAAPNSNILTTAGLSACSGSKASSCKCAAELYGWRMTLPDRRPTMVLCPQGACTHTTLRRSSLPPFFNGLLRKPSSYITGFSQPWQPHTKNSMHSPRLTVRRLGAQEVDMTLLCWPMSYWTGDEWGRCHISAAGESGGATKDKKN